MPSGYTSTLYEGPQTFEEFILGAARGMGALIMQRDDPPDAPIRLPRTSSHHEDRMTEAQERLKDALDLTPEAAEAAAEAAYAEDLARWKKSEQKSRDMEARYRDMLAAVAGWVPPTDDHVGLKDFMVRQLEDSIDFDCMTTSPPTRLTGEEYLAAQINRARRDVEYHRKALAEEDERTEGRRAWIKALADSIGAAVVDDVVLAQ